MFRYLPRRFGLGRYVLNGVWPYDMRALLLQ